jgi:hypothetical protein
MERSSMLMGWQKEYCENGYNTKVKLHVQCNLHQNPMTFITETKKSALKFIWKHKRPQIGKAILSKRSNPVGITIPNFKLCYRAIAIKKIALYLCKTILKTSGTE